MKLNFLSSKSSSNTSATPTSNITPQFQSTRHSFTRSRSFFKKLNFKFSKNILLGTLGIVVIAAIILIARSNKAPSTAQVATQTKPAAPIAKQTHTINKEFSFPIKDTTGKVISQIKYLFESASLQDEILVKGERARAVQGRTFLILNLKITNTYKQGIQINSRDYIRLIVNGNKNELVAADIHNDPVEVQAISTKVTRLGFPIDESFKALDIQIGEINGKKETVRLNFNK